MKKSRLLLTGIISLSIIISCKKGVNNPTEPTNPSDPKIDMPIKVLQIQYTPKQEIRQKSIYTFPTIISKSRIEYDRLDSLFSDVYFTMSTRNHTEYDFDPITKHLLKSSFRTAELFNNDPISSDNSENWDNAFNFSSHKDYPDTISTVNYTNYLMASQRAGFTFSLDRFAPDKIIYDQIAGLNRPTYQIILNDGGAVHLIDDDDNNAYPFSSLIPYYRSYTINQYWYFLDSANNCPQLVIKNGFIQQDPTLPQAYFQSTAELRSTFTYDNNTNEIKQLLGTIMLSKDLYWNRIAIHYTYFTKGKEPYYFFQRICKSYTDSLFTIDGTTSNFSSAKTYQNEILKDQKGRISSLICKTGSGGLVEAFYFTYAN